MQHRIHLLYAPGDVLWEELQTHLGSRFSITVGEDLPEEPDFHVLVAGRPTQEQIEASPDLRALVVPFAGIPAETRALLLKYPDLAVYNLHHNADATAEMALALLLSAAKCIIPIDRKFRQNDWSPRYQPNPSVLLHGKTALILGYGAIGKRVARSCLALGMDVQATRRQTQVRQVDDMGVVIHPAASLVDLLPGADALVVCLPLTEETKGLLDAEELLSLPQGAIVVNVARGPIIQAEALFQALETGHLHAAGLDVWYNYPKDEDERSETPPSDLPFASLDNVVMSPHRGGGSRENELVRARTLAALLESMMEGDEASNRVDLEAGY